MEARLLALYLMTSPHSTMLGIYYAPLAYIVYDVGLTTEQVTKAFIELNQMDLCSYDADLSYVWVHSMAKYQIAPQLKETDKRIKAINKLFQALPNLSFLEQFYQQYKDKFHLAYHPHLHANELEIVSKANDVNETTVEEDKEQENLLMQMLFDGDSTKVDTENNNHIEPAPPLTESVDVDTVVIDLNQPPDNSVVFQMPARGNRVVEITQDLVEKYQIIFPMVNIPKSLQKFKDWCLADPSRLKPANNMEFHVGQWLAGESRKVQMTKTLVNCQEKARTHLQ